MSKVKIFDTVGNQLEVGNLVLCTARIDLIGNVAEIIEGGLSLVTKSNANKTPAKIRIVFDTTIIFPPEGTKLNNFYRVVNPKSEEVLNSISDLEKRINLT
jgi:hypothetical protein